MSTPTAVREAKESDRETLLRFHKGLYQGHRDQVVAEEDLPLIAYRDYEQLLADDLRALLSDGDSHVLVAESDSEAVGYITGKVTVEHGRVLPRKGIVEDWYVMPDARGAGIGAALLHELQARFIAAGCDVIESATWTSNDGARRVHEALGFREIRVIYRKKVGG